MGQLHRGFALPCPSAECVSSAGTTWSGQEIGSCLNHSSYGKTVCLRTGLKPGLCFTAGTASTWTQQAAENPLQATSLGRPILLPSLALRCLIPQPGLCLRGISSGPDRSLSWDTSSPVCSQILPDRYLLDFAWAPLSSPVSLHCSAPHLPRANDS